MTDPKEVAGIADKLEDGQVCSPAQNSCRNHYLMLQAAARLRELEAENERLKKCLKSFVNGVETGAIKTDYADEVLANVTASARAAIAAAPTYGEGK